MDTLKEKVIGAVGLFVCNDLALLNLKVYEAAVSHRIAVYLEFLFFSVKHFSKLPLNFDCEYDKSLDQQKRGPGGRGLRPDILVHKRGKQEINLIAIEIKRRNKNAKDFQKLAYLTARGREFKYELGVFHLFPAEQSALRLV